MKFTVIFAAILSTSWALKVNQDVSKGKRETPTRYQSSNSYTFGAGADGGGGGGGYSVGSRQAPIFRGYGDDESSAVSIGAGYNIENAKPSFGFGPEDDGHLFMSSAEASNQQGLVQLPNQYGDQSGQFVSNDLSQLMRQLSHGLNSGQLQLASFQGEAQTAHTPQAIAVPQYNLEQPKLQYLLSQQHGISSVPSYAAGTKGLGSYGSTGPVLFNQELNTNPIGGGYTFANGGQSYEGGAASVEHVPSGASLENVGHSLGGAAHGFLGQGASFGSYGGSKGSINLPNKMFKSSVYVGGIGGSGQGHGAPSFASSSLPGGHGLSFGSAAHVFGLAKGGIGGSSGSKFFSPGHASSKKRYNSLDSFSSGSHDLHSKLPPRTTYGVPTGTYSSVQTSSISPSAISPQYHNTKYSGLSDGTSFKGTVPFRSHMYSGASPGYKHSFSSQPVGHFAQVNDVEGSFSENSYNTIKYSEELKPHM